MREYVLTEQLYQSSLKTPGEKRPISKDILEQGIAEGVIMGLFGLGELNDDKPNCRYFKEPASVALSGNEAIINEGLCREQREKEISEPEPSPYPQPDPETQPTDEKEIGDKEIGHQIKTKDMIQLKFRVPKGKVSGIMGVMNLLQNKYETLEIEIIAKDGEISEQDYEDKIEEAFRQLGIELDDK